MQKHWPVLFIEDILANFDNAIRPNPNEHSVEGRMVEFTQGKAICDTGFSLRVRIRDDVCRVEKLTVP